MFSVDAPKVSVDDPRQVGDVIRLVVSGNDPCVVDYPVLLAGKLPLGTVVTGSLQNDLWNVQVSPADQSVALSTRGGEPLLNLRVQGTGPCVLRIEVPSGVQVWGLGQCFADPDARVDWIGRRRTVADHGVVEKFRPYGHGLQSYVAGTEGYIQIPILIIAGGPQPFAIVLDYGYRIEADFTTNPWSVELGSAVAGVPTFPVRAYIVGGPTALDVRRRVMDLVGRPPVPPRKAFGLWLSEYGFENWHDVDRVVAGQRGGAFPLDGIVLDLFWFGGIAQQSVDHSQMGRLGWDITDDPGDDPYFPDPQGTLARYAAQHVGFALIEESYVNTSTATYTQIGQAVPNAFVRVGPSVLKFQNVWLGDEAAMLDWTNEQVGDWIHTNRRKPFVVDYGVQVHWTDLGEPELFDPTATYHGVDLTGNGSPNTNHADVANLYNLDWHRSIDRGYRQADPERRRLLLSRSGSAGIQRFGAAIWSGDTGSRMEVLVAHLHAQAHMSCSGIDYYGADVGGFRREVLLPDHLDELYTQWFANSAWFDVPLRPHVDNSAFYTQRAEGTLDSPQRNRVAPYEVGHVPSNLENLRTRYRLIPYYYSLAHLAAQTGSPLMPPPGIVYPDPDLRGIAHQKLIGANLMVAVVAGHGEYSRRVYLPAGTWYDFYTGERYVSTGTGEWFAFIPEYRDGLFRLPAFARAGGIIPMMYVDADTLDSAGHRPDGSTYQDLILRVFDDPDAASSFTVVEDDGTSTTSPSRQIHVDLRRADQLILVTVDAAADIPALADVRPLTVEVVSAFATSAVTMNGAALPQMPDVTRSQRGWTTVDTRTVRACVPDAAVTQQHTFAFHLAGPAPATASLLLVCDRAFTDWGENVYARFLQPVQTTRGPLTELKLDPSLTYPYMYPQPPDAQRNCPMWTLHLDEIDPNQDVRLTFEKRRDGTITHANPQQLYRATGNSGYAGELRGSLY